MMQLFNRSRRVNPQKNRTSSVVASGVISKRVRSQSKHECVKMVKEFSRLTASYFNLLASMGSLADAGELRQGLARCRRKALNTARNCHKALLPNLRGNVQPEMRREYRKLWDCFVACLELFFIFMQKTQSLQCTFIIRHTDLTSPIAVSSVASGAAAAVSTTTTSACLLIHTGNCESFQAIRKAAYQMMEGGADSDTDETVDTPAECSVSSKARKNSRQPPASLQQAASQSASSHDDDAALDRDIREVHNLISDVRNEVAMFPWAEPTVIIPDHEDGLLDGVTVGADNDARLSLPAALPAPEPVSRRPIRGKCCRSKTTRRLACATVLSLVLCAGIVVAILAGLHKI